MTAMLMTRRAGHVIMTHPEKAVVAAEALVPVHTSQGESTMRQRLMARLGTMQGSSATAASPAHAQPDPSRAGVNGHGSAAVLRAQGYLTHAPNGTGQDAAGKLRATRTSTLLHSSKPTVQDVFHKCTANSQSFQL